MTISNLLLQYVITFGWALTAALSMAVSLGILIKVFDWMTPIDEWGEIKKGNMAMAVVLGSVVLGTALVIALTLSS